MQNLNNQPSVFDSETPEAAYPNGKSRQGYENVHANPPIPESAVDIDPTAEPPFLDAIDPETGELRPEPETALALATPHPSQSTVMQHAQTGRSLRLQWRFIRTLAFAAWLFARVVLWHVYIVKVFPGWVDRTSLKRFQQYAREYAGFAKSMGGLFIKLGQFISTRVDIFPEEIIREMESLQDEVPTIKFSKIKTAIEAELGPIHTRYREFDETPIAAASLGQVHRARLNNGDKVVVKVQRPGIRDICFTDLAAMRIIARVAMRFGFINRRCDAPALVEEFGRVFLEELSYKHEAYNADRFMEMFKNNMGVYIPSIYHEHSTDQILTIEDVTTIKINDYAALEKAGISRKAVAKRLMDTYLKQIFDEYFFHADPHPGNLFIYPLPVDDENADFGRGGRPFYLIFVDFGMTGTLTREIADGMVSTLNAVLTRNARQLVEGYVRLGFILPGADVSASYPLHSSLLTRCGACL